MAATLVHASAVVAGGCDEPAPAAPPAPHAPGAEPPPAQTAHAARAWS
ncbi:MAG: hypothetical protein R3A52_10135 [Polyangiales bacterium]